MSINLWQNVRRSSSRKCSSIEFLHSHPDTCIFRNDLSAIRMLRARLVFHISFFISYFHGRILIAIVNISFTFKNCNMNQIWKAGRVRLIKLSKLLKAENLYGSHNETKLNIRRVIVYQLLNNCNYICWSLVIWRVNFEEDPLRERLEVLVVCVVSETLKVIAQHGNTSLSIFRNSLLKKQDLKHAPRGGKSSNQTQFSIL